jgi:hypothetical protein
MQDLTPQRPGETVLRLKTLSARVDRRAMRRLAFVGLLLLVGCQSEDHAYDAEAKAQARAVAPSVATYGRLVSVGRAVEREECSEAQPFVAGRCLDVVVTRDMAVIDEPGETTRVRTHVFVWLEREAGHWTVEQTSSWSPDITVSVESGWPGR